MVPALFFIIMVVYRPFGNPIALDFGRSLFYFNITMMMCIILVYLALTRTLLYALRKHLCTNWWFYVGWMILECVGLTFFFGLYLRLISGQAPYFLHVANSLQYTFLILCVPYGGVTAICTIVEYSSPNIREHDSIRFTDKNGQAKIVLIKDAILYIRANENYVTIYYKDGENVKSYTLRTSMASIAPLVERFGLYRCQRSYFVNTQHIVALRRDANDIYSAELCVPGIIIPVSRQKYSKLSSIL